MSPPSPILSGKEAKAIEEPQATDEAEDDEGEDDSNIPENVNFVENIKREICELHS